MDALTEAEAKLRWCPFARTFTKTGFMETYATVNRGRSGHDAPQIEADCRCIASACMAWRWRDPIAKLKDPRDAREAQSRFDWNAIQQQPAEYAARFERCEDKGFCGMTGRE